MTRSTRRQLGVLGALAVLLLVILVWPDGSSPTGTQRAPSNPAARAAARGGDTPVTDVKLEQLRRERAAVPEPKRNPFRFQAAAPPRQVVDPGPAPRFEDFPPPAPAGPPPQPPIPLRFIGVIEAPTGRVGIFSDARTPGQGDVFHGKEGEIIEGRYRVARLGADSAELVYVDGQGRQTIRLSGQ